MTDDAFHTNLKRWHVCQKGIGSCDNDRDARVQMFLSQIMSFKDTGKRKMSSYSSTRVSLPVHRNPVHPIACRTLDRLEGGMSAINDQIRPGCETPSLTEEEDGRSSEFVGCGKAAEHGPPEPLFLQVGTSGEEVVSHGCSNITRGEGLQ